ncbi:NmrA domain-containing protein [Trichoderma simmonsii]|uniref:NmrA domain-containing protein n=1 Tax=Trichoderma simmonsii TaxID=1491479 RepID=A0A8G0LV66_9HYPO|nr:NmrA domain-containing protein [Trichoderma simmonsii]
MLVLIVGITGNIGLKLASALIFRGHSVRGASRSIATLPDNIRGKLESLFETKSWYDAETLRKAMKGVDAVVCAYSPIPALALEAELLLVRIMEEEGIKRFIPSIWNLDWSQLQWGDVPYYDLFLALQRQLALSSTVDVLYIFTGILAEVFFSVPGHGGFAPSNHGVWDPESSPKRAEVWGSGEEKWQITTELDCADFTAELIVDLTKRGGSYRVCSFEHSIREIASIYQDVRGVSVQLDYMGSIEDLRVTANTAVREIGLKRFWDWMGYFYQLYQLNGTCHMKQLDSKQYSSLRLTSLAEFLKDNMYI